jgi:hypothetical protein
VTPRPSIDTSAVEERVVLRMRREALVARVDMIERERERERRALERVPHCAGCGLAHSGRHTHEIGTLCPDCHLDSRLGRFPRSSDDLRDVLAWRAVTGDRGSGIKVIWGLSDVVGFKFFSEAYAEAVEVGTVRPEAGRRFAFAPLEAMRARLDACETEPPPGMRRTSLDELAAFAAARRRARTEKSRPEPLVVTDAPNWGSFRPVPGPDGVIPSTSRLGDGPWQRFKNTARRRRKR